MNDNACFYYLHSRRPTVRNADRIEYHWGKDLSGTLDGAAGVGGLLYVKMNGAIYVPFYDAFGNVMGYWDEQGNVVAGYAYDAFGRTVAKSGTMADVFSIRYSTKYYDAVTGMYYYGKRYYVVALCRWLTRDPIEEQGGVNLYGFCGNQSISSFDLLGLQECEINAFFKQPKMPFQIGQYVDVVGSEITHRNVMGDFFSWIPAQRKELDRYVWTVNFIPRFSPPNENRRGPSSDQGKNALGGFVRAYRPEVGNGDLGFSVWGDPVVLGEEWSVAGVLLKRRTDYPNKKFRFGYFVYVAQSESAPFVLTDYNDDMFSVWNGGISKLPDADRYATGKRGHCEIVEVQYGDVGKLMGRIRFPKRKGAK